MEANISSFISGSFLALMLLLVVAIVWIQQSALKKLGISYQQRNATLWYSSAAFVLWISGVSVATLLGYFDNYDAFPPRIILLVLITILILISLLFSRRVTLLLRYVNPEYLILIHSIRIFVEIIMMALYYDYVIPEQMTFEGMNYDILIGFTAPFIAYFCFISKTLQRWAAVVWNLTGIALISNKLTIATLSAPYSFRYFMNEPSNLIGTVFPFSLLSTFLFPVIIILHLLSLKQVLFKLDNKI